MGGNMSLNKALLCCVAASFLSVIGCAAKITATRGDLGPLSNAKIALISANVITPQGTFAYTGRRIRLEAAIAEKYQPEIDEFGKRPDHGECISLCGAQVHRSYNGIDKPIKPHERGFSGAPGAGREKSGEGA